MSILSLRWVQDESDPMACLLAHVQGMPAPQKLQYSTMDAVSGSLLWHDVELVELPEVKP